ncbi:MAG: hypothetical protein HY934_02955 [Candidatus Firestonebacteria bacterium]|nr:hypothetical protein [Candidatus Firestonebacteria bacterium]
MKKIKRYKWAIVTLIFLIAILAISNCIYGKIDPLISAIVALLTSIPFNLFWQTYNSPVLIIEKKPECRTMNTDNGYKYECNRIIVKNIGKTAAKNCKGYIVIENNKERVCWTISKERPNAIINSKDNEKLDFCAFLIKKGHPDDEKLFDLIAPTENGWNMQIPQENRPIENINECCVLVTTENAEPIEAIIKFNKTNKIIEII